jgi:two-component system, OmpR family, sensor kinase
VNESPRIAPSQKAVMMTNNADGPLNNPDQDRLLETLQRLLEISATSLPEAMTLAAQLLVEAFAADKFDAFLYEARIDSLVALGVSNTPMGYRQRALGLDRLPVTNGGRSVEAFQTGLPYRNGAVEHDAGELPGIRQGLGVRSSMNVALEVNASRRGAGPFSCRPRYRARPRLRLVGRHSGGARRRDSLPPRHAGD